MFPALPEMNLALIVLSYGFYLHKAKNLMRRLSRFGFNFASCSNEEDVQFDRFTKKKMDIPISTTCTFV